MASLNPMSGFSIRVEHHNKQGQYQKKKRGWKLFLQKVGSYCGQMKQRKLKIALQNSCQKKEKSSTGFVLPAFIVLKQFKMNFALKKKIKKFFSREHLSSYLQIWNIMLKVSGSW